SSSACRLGCVRPVSMKLTCRAEKPALAARSSWLMPREVLHLRSSGPTARFARPAVAAGTGYMATSVRVRNREGPDICIQALHVRQEQTVRRSFVDLQLRARNHIRRRPAGHIDRSRDVLVAVND